MRRRTGRKKLGVVKIAAIIVALLVVVSAIGGGGSKEKAADDTRTEVAETTKAAETSLR